MNTRSLSSKRSMLIQILSIVHFTGLPSDSLSLSDLGVALCFESLRTEKGSRCTLQFAESDLGDRMIAGGRLGLGGFDGAAWSVVMAEPHTCAGSSCSRTSHTSADASAGTGANTSTRTSRVSSLSLIRGLRIISTVLLLVTMRMHQTSRSPSDGSLWLFRSNVEDEEEVLTAPVAAACFGGSEEPSLL
jgi:hypothetical protein